MKIVLDLSFLRSTREGGVSTYAANVAHLLTRTSDLGIQLDLRKSFGMSSEACRLGLMKRIPILPYIPSFVPGIGMLERNLCRSLNSVSTAASVDLVHRFWYEEQGRELFPGARSSVTVYDMIPEDHPGWWSTTGEHRGKQYVVQNADLIFCISNYTKERLVHHYPGLRGNIVVTPLGVDLSRFGSRKSMPRAGVVYVGNRGRYKNWPLLLDALKHLKKKSISLTCVGGGAFAAEEKRLMTGIGVRNQVQYAGSNSRTVVQALQSASVYVSTSIDEGFSLPTLEAMAAGAVCVVPDIPVHREVAGNAAVYYQPGDSGDLSQKMEILFESPEYLVEMQEQGYLRSRMFPWTQTAKIMEDAFRELLT